MTVTQPDAIPEARPVATHELHAPGASITYDVRGDVRTATPSQPPLLLVGSPMDASGFGTLASHFPDRVVVTYDPRGTGRSAKDDPSTPSTPEEHGDDLHRVVEALGAGPVDLFASSGGAVNALALVAAHPEDVRILVAHEPPLVWLVPDREAASAAVHDVGAAYQREGFGAGMARFIALTGHQGPIPDDFADLPKPSAADFGMPTEDDGVRTDPLLFQNLVTCTHHEPDVAALRAASTRLVVAVGEESGEELAARGGRALAALLDVEPVVFPSGHGGFLGDEYGMPGKPVEFAAALRQALADAGR